MVNIARFYYHTFIYLYSMLQKDTWGKIHQTCEPYALCTETLLDRLLYFQDVYNLCEI